MSHPDAAVGELAGLAAALAWAVGSTLFSRIGRAASPLSMNLGKCLSAGLLLGVTLVAMRGLAISAPAPALGWLVASAVAGLTIGDTAYFNALVRLGVPRAILLLSTAPVFAAIGARIFLDEPLGARSALGIAVTLAGIALTVTSSTADASTGHESSAAHRARTALGLGFGVLAGLGQAAGSLLSKQAMTAGLDPLFVSSGRLLVGGVTLLLAAAIRGRLPSVARDLGENRAWLRIAGAGLVGSYAGIWLSQIALAKTPSTGVASTLLATSPVFALPIAHLLGDERIRPRGAFGAFVTVGGVALLSG